MKAAKISHKLDDESRCRKAAIDLLSRREHSRFELRRKLLQKPYAEGVDLDELLDQLETANYLSNTRYAESFVRSRILKGQGEIKIRQLLLQRGVSLSTADHAIAEADVNWWDLAEQQRIKRFGEDYPDTLEDKAKQIRFLTMRGFPSSIVREITQI
ncbi:MAG: regulatory protein RecX [Leucothrix sp.]